jgi:hypothetical protein
MWEAALDRITSLVGRAFVIGSLVPVLLFTGANLLSILVVFGRQPLAKLVREVTVYPWLTGAGAALALVALGYLLLIVGPVARRLLEGAYDLGLLTEWLKSWKRRDFLKRRNQVQNFLREDVEIRRVCEELMGKLKELNKGRSKNVLPRAAAGGKLQEVEQTIRDCTGSGKLPTVDELRKLAEGLEQLYASDAPLAGIEDFHSQFAAFCEDVQGLTRARYSQALADLQSRYPVSGRSAEVQATSLGNLMAASWAYAYTRFGIDAAFMWSRLRGCLSEPHARAVEDDRTSYDFCLSMVVLSVLYAPVWAAIVVLRWPPPWPLSLQPPVWQVLLPLAGVASAILFYLAALEAARSFGSNLRSCFDLFRFDLLKALHIELPKDIRGERETWRKLNQIFVYSDSQLPLDYRHPDQPEREEDEKGGGRFAKLRDWLGF